MELPRDATRLVKECGEQVPSSGGGILNALAGKGVGSGPDELDEGARLQAHALEIIVKIGFPTIAGVGVVVLLVSQVGLNALADGFGRQAQHHIRLCSGEFEKAANVTVEELCKGEDGACLAAEFLELAFPNFNNPARVG
jgi:hypothetical protein